MYALVCDMCTVRLVTVDILNCFLVHQKAWPRGQAKPIFEDVSHAKTKTITGGLLVIIGIDRGSFPVLQVQIFWDASGL